MTAKEARALMPSNVTIEKVLSEIKCRVQLGGDFLYAKINNDTLIELIQLGYNVDYIEDAKQYRISW